MVPDTVSNGHAARNHVGLDLPALIDRKLQNDKENTSKNAVNDALRRIHEMVETVKKDPETSIAYLRLQEKLSKSRKEGRKICSGV